MERRKRNRPESENNEDGYLGPGVLAAIEATRTRVAHEAAEYEYAHPQVEPPDSVQRRTELEASYPSEVAHSVGCSDPVAETRAQRILAGIREAKENVDQEVAAYYGLHPPVEPPAPEPTFMLDGQNGYFYEELPGGSLRYAGDASRQVQN